MAGSRVEYGEWCKRKVYGSEAFQWIWKFKRPFKERPKWDSRATFCRGALEVWFNMHPGESIADTKKTEREVKKKLRELFNVEGIDICEVSTMLGFTRVAYYCRVAVPPAQELMEKVPGLVENAYVEAEVSRWDAKTGEYQGTYRLTEFDTDTRVRILKNIAEPSSEKLKKFKAVQGSRWAFAN